MKRTVFALAMLVAGCYAYAANTPGIALAALANAPQAASGATQYDHVEWNPRARWRCWWRRGERWCGWW